MDVIFESEDPTAMTALLKEMNNWDSESRRSLLGRWNILNTEATIREFESKYDCKIVFPPYKKPDISAWATKPNAERY